MITNIETITRNPVTVGGGFLMPTVIAILAPYAPSGPIIAATSLSTASIGGPKAFVVQYALGFQTGMRLRAAVDGLPNSWLEGVVTSYSGNNLVIASDLTSGSGTHADWLINVTGQPGLTGPTGPQGVQGVPGAVPEAPTDGEIYGRKNSNWVPAGIGALTAADVANVPAGNIGATDVQAAIDELNLDKLATAGGIMSGHLELPTGPAAADAVRKDYVDAGLLLKAPLESPAFSGTPTAPTPTAGDNDTSVATTAFVAAAVAAAGGVAPSNAVPLMDGTGAAGSSALYARGDHRHPTDTALATLTYVNTQDALRVNKVGDTMTGQLIITSSASPTLNLNKPSSGFYNCILGNTNGSSRWFMALGDSAGETGSNAGSDFALYSYNDVGAFIATPLTIKRSSSLITTAGQVYAPGFRTTTAINPGIGNNYTGVEIQTEFIAVSRAQATGYFNVTSSASNLIFQIAGAIAGSISNIPGGTAYNTASDARLKEDLKTFDAGHVIDDTNVYDFAWKDTQTRAFGVIAQEAVNVYPNAIHHDEANDWWGVDYGKYMPVVLQELKALRARVAELEVLAGLRPATPDPKKKRK